MAEVRLFHHAQGLTRGCLSFADELRAAGHVVHAPDLYDGKIFTDLTDGVRYAEQVGFDTIIERGRLAADSLRTKSSMRASRSGCYRRRCWPRQGPVRRERLKSIEVPGNKLASVTKLLDRAAAGQPEVRTLLESEAKEVTRIGNDFQIRHTEAGKAAIVRDEDLDYLFHRGFALIRFVLRAAGRGS